MRGLAICLSIALGLLLSPVASAASLFYVNGGGDGHGIGMSQYGAYGYALHGKDYRFILGHYYQGTALGSTDPNQTVRVLIGTGTATFSGAATDGASKKLKPGATYAVKALPDGTLSLLDQSGKKVGHYYTLAVSGPGPLNLAGHGAYRGALEFRVVGGAVQTVNAVGLDDYVRGVVSWEMPSSWSPAALEAQAVAARTYALTSNVGGDGYQLYPDTRSQMYGGVSAQTPATDAAVAATRGQIVTYNGSPATTFFFSSSGGYTEDIENVWLGSTPEPWLRGVSDPYDGAASNPYHRWTHQLTIAAAAARLGALVKGKLVGIRVTQHGVSPRVVSAEVIGSKGTTTVTGPKLQGIFGLYSTYMAFTTISSTPGLPVPTTNHALTNAPLVAAEAGFAAVVKPPRGLQGTVAPAPPGSLADVQLSTRRGWRTVAHARLGSGGAYAVRLAAPGTYRVVYHGLAGPAVTVG